MCKKGRFIVFEGLDGCGKTSQLIHLQKKLLEHGLTCSAQREPSDGVIGRVIRDAIEKKIDLHEETLALLFAADRYEHIQADVLPCLKQGTHVLCDRYVFSNLAYQSLALPIEAIVSYNRKNIETLLPDLTIFIDTPPEECIRRIAAARAQTERYENLEQMQKVYRNFEAAFTLLAPTDQLLRVKGDQEEALVFETIWQHIQPLL